MVCQQSDQEQNIFVNLKPFDLKDVNVFVETLIDDLLSVHYLCNMSHTNNKSCQ